MTNEQIVQALRELTGEITLVNEYPGIVMCNGSERLTSIILDTFEDPELAEAINKFCHLYVALLDNLHEKAREENAGNA